MTTIKPSFGKLSSFNQHEIKILFRTARTVYQAPGVTIKKALKQGPFARILIVTPRKAGNAPARNLIRRRLKSIFFTHQLYQEPEDSIILVALPAHELSFTDLKEIMLTIYGKQHGSS